MFINHYGFFFLRELQYSLVDPILDNILKTPTRVSTMIPRVVILTVYFSPKLLFVRELVILRKCDEFLLHKKIKRFPRSLPHQMYIGLV